MKIDFSRGKWDLTDITYAYTWRFEETPVFVQKDDCVENLKNAASPQKYDNVSILTREKFPFGTRISTRCAFEGDAAPLITIAKQMDTDSRGVKRYGEYLEIVLWKNGVNVWRMNFNDGKVTWKKAMGIEFPVDENEIHTLTVDVLENVLKIDADGRKMHLYVNNFYPEFHLGIDACEGIQRFYDMTIEKIEG